MFGAGCGVAATVCLIGLSLEKILLDDKADAQKFISLKFVKCMNFTLKCKNTS